MKKTKQIGYLSIIAFVVASTIGAGIFFKNSELNSYAQGNLWLVISVWVVASIGIIAMGLAIVEISSSQKTNHGFIEWIQKFTNKWFMRSSINYIKYFYNTFTMFSLPIYAIMSLQDAGWKLPDGWALLVAAYIIFTFFSAMNLFSLNASAFVQRGLTLIKFIPLLILPIFALVNVGHLDAGNTIVQKVVVAPVGINSVSPFIILIAGLPAISFAFDGFYTVSSIQEQAVNQKKMGWAMTLGLVIIMSVYLFLSISFNLGSNDGTHNGINLWFISQPIWSGILKAANVFIALAIFGIINGYAMSGPRQLASLAKDQECNDLLWLQLLIFRKVAKKNDDCQLYFVAWLFFFFSSTLVYVLFGLIGYYGYVGLDVGNYASAYGKLNSQIYNLTDVMVNYTSMIIFFIIATAILGGIINRFTKKVVVKKIKGFFFFASISVLMMYAGAIYSLISTIIDSTGYLNADKNISLIKLGIFLGLIIFPTLRPLINVLIYKIYKQEWKWFKFRLPNKLDYDLKRVRALSRKNSLIFYQNKTDIHSNFATNNSDNLRLINNKIKAFNDPKASKQV